MMKRYLLLVVLLLAFFASPLFSQDLYWNNPRIISNGEALFPTVAGENETSFVVWQEVERQNDQKGTIWLSGQFFQSQTQKWITRERFAGPFSYSGEAPNIFSVAASDTGIASIAVLTSPNTVSVYTSDNQGQSFTKAELSTEGRPVAPRIFKDARGGFIVFTTKGVEQSFSFDIARSLDGITWTPFSSFTPTQSLNNSFVPILSVLPDGKELVVFQSTVTENNRNTYQLFSTYNQSTTEELWTAPIMVTSSEAIKDISTNYSNQRPYLHSFNDKTYLAWERTSVASQSPSIYLAELSPTGSVIGNIEQITQDNIIARQPIVFTYKDQLTILWFDTRYGTESIYFAQKRGLLWLETRISTANISSVFGFPLVTNSNRDLHIFWEQESTDDNSQVIRLSVDRDAPSPNIKPLSFTEGKRSSSDKIEVLVDTGNDSSGIAGYSWILTKSAFLNPPRRFMNFPTEDTITTYVEEDGRWYIKARTLDNAGNWSKPSVITYFRDTTPPLAPKINDFTKLNGEYQSSNSFSVSWENTDSEDIVSGYTYSLQYISSLENYIRSPESFTSEKLAEINPSLPANMITKNNIVSWNNYGNGVFLFSVAAIDSVGNIGESTSVPIYLNNYIPYTTITTAYPKTDVFGKTNLIIYGKGFTYDGTISAIYLDRDGIAPYDFVLEKKDGDYTVTSDTKITGIEFSNLEKGNYRIGLLHTDRGLFMSRPLLPIDEYGTVKLGDYSFTFSPNWNTISQVFDYTIQISDIVLLAVFILAIFGMIFAIRGLIITAKNTVIVQKEVQALITGGDMPAEAKQKMKALKKKGMSLKYKMMLFISVLVLTVITIVAIPFGYAFIQTQEETLADGLKQRINVLTDSLAAGVKNFMPTANLLELGLLLDQSKSMNEVVHATILGLPLDGQDTNLDHVWVSNDPNIADKIDTESLVLGSSRYTNEQLVPLLEKMEELNSTAIGDVGDITENIGILTQEGISLALSTDESSIARRNEIQSIINQLTENLTIKLNSLSSLGSGSTPEFTTAGFSEENSEYLFYKPVLFRQGSEQTYTRGIVLLEISIDNLLQSLADAQMTIFTTTAIIAIFAIAIGVIGSFMLASIIIRPIRRLSSHVQMIRDTEDKEELSGKDIIIKARDEIGELGDIVNDMTHGLVKAAAAAKDLTVGKEVQKMFIPLSVDETGKKLTTGIVEDENASFFGYYEGAKGVSGDYFDYLKLDDRHFAVIKCDVSGKGVPASLIMVEVATLFLNYFKDWSYKKDKYNLSGIVGRINDLIESRGFKGRFAAFTLCIFDSVGGDVHFCNAGDNLVHIYDASEKKKKTITLTETPASGVFPTFMVDMKGGFIVEKLHLDKDDVLFLYTDGIEEAKRLFRDKDYNLINCEEPGLGEGDVHGMHTFGMDGEEMAPERVNDIIEAVFARGSYKIEKFHSPINNEELAFDFSTCEGSAEDAIMALVSVEKIFRMYPNPKATEFDRVQVDRKIDSFLQEHFMQYNDYCSNKKNHPQFNEYMYYTHINEDEQYDDLTLVAIKKK